MASDPPQVTTTLLAVERDAVRAEVIGDGLAQLEEALGRPVGQDRVVEIVEGVDDGLRRRDIGVADVQENRP